jgi:bifunctional DNA-binding transcriptional regulator/antitoxin component of YhaV-PrlF toxin-antitoxin module
MIVEIKGRELTATYHQGRLYIPKPFRDMFGLKDNDILVIKIVEHSHSTKRRNPPIGIWTKRKNVIVQYKNLQEKTRRPPLTHTLTIQNLSSFLMTRTRPLGTMMSNAWPLSFWALSPDILFDLHTYP